MCNRFIDKLAENIIEKMENSLKIYHVVLPNEIDLGYDSCSDFITAAYSEEEARKTRPECAWIDNDKIDKLLVFQIGNASENIKPGIIISHNWYG